MLKRKAVEEAKGPKKPKKEEEPLDEESDDEDVAENPLVAEGSGSPSFDGQVGSLSIITGGS